MKPKHQGGYTTVHAQLCERTLVTLLRGLGPWKSSIYLVGGLVPRYLIPQSGTTGAPPTHVGTTDVDIVVDLKLLAATTAYRTLEKNLKALGFNRGENEEGQAQHHSWRRRVDETTTIVLDLLCDTEADHAARIVKLPGQHRLSALQIPGAHLVSGDHIDIALTAELLDDGGVATETIQVANIVPFVVLKSLALRDRWEEKDAYDLVYCLRYYRDGPTAVAAEFAVAVGRWPDEPLLDEAIAILEQHFVSDEHTAGWRKDGPASYARFCTDPGRTDMNARNRRDAAGTVEAFVRSIQGRKAK